LPVAELKLDAPIDVFIPKGSRVIGKPYGPTFAFVIDGTLHEDIDEGDEILRIRYDVTDGHGCQVGANPEPQTEGCECNPSLHKFGFNFR